jgi:hypothetical protein
MLGTNTLAYSAFAPLGYALTRKHHTSVFCPLITDKEEEKSIIPLGPELEPPSAQFPSPPSTATTTL